MIAPAFVERVAKSGHAMVAAKLNEMREAVAMLRPSLVGDFSKNGVESTAGDAWVFSIWSGYLKTPEYKQVRADTYRRLRPGGEWLWLPAPDRLTAAYWSGFSGVCDAAR